jgi:hypothetical protein
MVRVLSRYSASRETSGVRLSSHFKFQVICKNREGAHEWDTNAMTPMRVDRFVEELQTLDVSVGILLNHHYGYESKSIYGCDKLLLDAFERKGLKVDMKPVF